jgi:hypothetical protein
VKDSTFGKAKLAVTLETRHDITTLQAMTLADSQGNPIAFSEISSGQKKDNGAIVFTRTLGLESKAESMKLTISYFSKVETFLVPFEATVSVGLKAETPNETEEKKEN